MKQKKAVRIFLPDRPLRAGCKELIEVFLRIPDAIEIIESNAIFEGRCRASFSGQDSLHTLIEEIVPFQFSAIQQTSPKGIDIIPEGQHCLPVVITIPHHLPGTFTGKTGAISYRFLIKLKIKRLNSRDKGTIECEKIVDILGRVRLDQQPSFAKSVSISRHVKKKILFLNRLDAKISFELDRAAFLVGEHILMVGEIKNEHTGNTIKHVSMELRQNIIYISGDSQRKDNRLITRLIIGSVSPNETFQIHHSLQIPIDCYPSLCLNGNPVQVTYEILLTDSGNFEIGVPVFIGNCGTPLKRPSIQVSEYPDSSISDQTSIYYCVPPSENAHRKADPPPYSSTGYSKIDNSANPQPFFIPIHLLKAQNRQFAPAFSMPGMFYSGPPKYDYNFNRTDSAPPTERFLKIEEIE